MSAIVQLVHKGNILAGYRREDDPREEDNSYRKPDVMRTTCMRGFPGMHPNQ